MTQDLTEIAEPQAVKWYARANDASFKPTAGGYVFKAPSPWVLARPTYYLVTGTQKAALLAGLARWRLMLVCASLINAVVCSAPALLISLWPNVFARPLVPLLQSVGYTGLILIVSLAMALVVIPGIVAAQIYLARVLRSALVGAPFTDERIKRREQMPKVATSASKIVLTMGLVGGTLMIVGGGINLLDAYLEGQLARSAVSTVSTLVFGALLTAYFIYLVVLRVTQKQAAARSRGGADRI